MKSIIPAICLINSFRKQLTRKSISRTGLSGILFNLFLIKINKKLKKKSNQMNCSSETWENQLAMKSMSKTVSGGLGHSSKSKMKLWWDFFLMGHWCWRANQCNTVFFLSEQWMSRSRERSVASQSYAPLPWNPSRA